MYSAAERPEFTPPRDKGSLRALALALLVHILLIAALTWGVSWKRSDESASFEAELWTSAAQQAAPAPVETTPPVPEPPAETAPAEPAPPAPLAAPVPVPEPVPVPLPVPLPPPAKAPEARIAPAQPDVDIALEQEKKRKLLQQRKEAELRKAQELQEKREAELLAQREKALEKKKEQALKARQELAERKAMEQAEKAAEKKQQAKEDKQKLAAAAAAEKQKLAAASAAADKKQAALAANAAAAAEKKKQAEIQQRIMAMAGAAGGADAKGTAAKSGGPSAGYGGKVRAKVLPNVVFTDEITGNPEAEVEVRTTADGTIMSQRLVKSSGNKAWDAAVIKAIIRTGSLPRDIDGRVPTPMIIEFRPN